jgi:5-methylcytosine-specific restriction endonuclease McrA
MMRRTQMRNISAKKLAKLAEQGITHPTSTLLSRKPVTAKRGRDTGPDKATVDAVLERDGYQCVVCSGGLHGTRGVGYSVHHRKLRSQGGDNRLSNLISVCGHGTAGCHSNLHGAPTNARKAGWIVSRQREPAQTVMAHSLYGFVLLDDQGGWSKWELS